MDFFEPSKNRFDYRSIFADDLYTQLKEGVTDNLIKNMPDNEMRKLALALSEGNYESKYHGALFFLLPIFLEYYTLLHFLAVVEFIK